jgi:putative transcriptional regulator
VPIIVNLDVVLAQRKMRLNTVAEKVGITAQNLSVLKTGKARAIRFSTLEKLCEILECQPGDLLAYAQARMPDSDDPREASVTPQAKLRT